MAFQQPPGTFQAYGLPKSMVLEFRLLPQPCSVVREVTLKAMNTLDEAGKKNSADSRIVLNGPPGCGKSFLLVQAVNYAISTGWIVLYIPRAITLLNSSTKHQYDIRTRTFQQPSASQQLLKRFVSVNNEALQTMKTSLPIDVERLSGFTPGLPLLQLIQAGVRDPNLAPDILSIVLDQLGAQTERPVLLAVDDFQALYCTSEYRDPDFNLIQSQHLSIPRLLLEYAGGLKSFAKGAVLGAVSSTNTNYLLPLVLREALGLPHDRSTGPYAKRSPALYPYLKDLRLFDVPPQLSISEASAMFKLWSTNLALHTRVNDELFLSKYTESSGNARCFVWGGLLATLES
ncbi:mitochondrial ribosomal death-associated protein 3-domain-containing protein [Hysterangium stoloniferum]|nr:mitochondrial ribosomal death-associated protein 3-domain-containing protein [Hysterangium stoloniferum]